jgi:hypothetical protein
MALLTLKQALEFQRRWERAARYDQLLSVRMPNGRRLRQCDAEYITTVASEMMRLTNHNESNTLFSQIGVSD